MPFVDTNVLLYAYDLSAGDRHERALAIIAETTLARNLVLSTQVLNEFFWQVTRPHPKPSLSLLEASNHVNELINVSKIVAVDKEISLRAIELTIAHKVSFWDGLIVAAAKRSEVDVLLTEDMQHGQTIDGVLIQNPFL